MEVLIVTFKLEGITEAEYYHGCDEEAPAFAEIPGLLSKVWLSSPATNTFGGVYTFESREALDAYVASDLFAALKAAEPFVDMQVTDFAVLDGPTRVTGGAMAAARR